MIQEILNGVQPERIKTPPSGGYWIRHDFIGRVIEKMSVTTLRDRIGHQRATSLVRRAANRTWYGRILSRIGLTVTKDVREEIQIQVAGEQRVKKELS